MKITPLLRYPPSLQFGITVISSLCVTAAYCRHSTNFSNGLRIFYLNKGQIEKVT